MYWIFVLCGTKFPVFKTHWKKQLNPVILDVKCSETLCISVKTQLLWRNWDIFQHLSLVFAKNRKKTEFIIFIFRVFVCKKCEIVCDIYNWRDSDSGNEIIKNFSCFLFFPFFINIILLLLLLYIDKQIVMTKTKLADSIFMFRFQSSVTIVEDKFSNWRQRVFHWHVHKKCVRLSQRKKTESVFKCVPEKKVCN